jgi:hypothetical protein
MQRMRHRFAWLCGFPLVALLALGCGREESGARVENSPDYCSWQGVGAWPVGTERCVAGNTMRCERPAEGGTASWTKVRDGC